MRKTFPKEGDAKLKETVQKLKAERRMLLKKIKFLEDELINLQKPVRIRKEEPKPLTSEEWRKQFAERFKQSLKRNNDE